MKTLINWLIAGIITSSGAVIAGGIGGGGSGVHPAGTPSIVDNGNATAITIDSAENVGIGNSSLENFHSDYSALQLGGNATFMAHSVQGPVTGLYTANNAYYDGIDSRWEYISASDASLYELRAGGHHFKAATAGALPDDPITWTTALAINSAGNVEVNGTSTFDGQVILAASTTETRRLSIGDGRTGNGYAHIDLIGDATYSGYGLRIIRADIGANSATQLRHRGTGSLDFVAEEAADIGFYTSGIERINISSNGNVTSAKSCASGYTRISPNYCRLNGSYLGTVLTRDVCTTVAAPATDAVLVDMQFIAEANGASGIASRNSGVAGYTGGGCSTAQNVVLAQGYEFVATTSTISKTFGVVSVKVVGGNSYVKQYDDAGNTGSGRYLIVGYHD